MGSTWGQIFLCCSHDETDYLKNKLDEMQSVWTVFNERTVTKFRTSNLALCRWLEENFGKGAKGKKVPSWILSLPREYRQALLDGYFSADGWVMKSGKKSATMVSKALGLGIRLIAES